MNPHGPEITSFANHVVVDWEDTMDRFFTAVAKKAQARDLTDAQVRLALSSGYGDEIADQWDEWAEAE